MAVTVVTKTLNVTLLNNLMEEDTFKIDNAKDGLTLAQVRSVYAPVLGNEADPSVPSTIAGGLGLFDKNGNPYTFVKQAAVVETTTRYTDLT